jgi:hypothetical protein
MVIQRFLWEFHVFCHTAVYVVLEAVYIMLLAHPMPSSVAEFAVPARDDLFRDDPVAQLEISFDFLAHFNDSADEFVTGYHRRFDIRGISLAAPKAGRAVICFQIAGADTAGFHFNNDLAFSRSGNWHLFQFIVSRRMSY